MAATSVPPPPELAEGHRQGIRGNNLHHGQKRRASDELESNTANSSQFKKLRIKPPPLPARPVGVSFRSPNATTIHNQIVSPGDDISPHNTYYGTRHDSQDSSDFMPVDETPHRIVIHDLAAEIAEIEAEEQAQTLFLPDVDKKVSAIPQKLLQDRDAQTDNSTALVLYRDPASISVPEEEDAVRVAIAAARQRARERQILEQLHQHHSNAANTSAGHTGVASSRLVELFDPDAMEIE